MPAEYAMNEDDFEVLFKEHFTPLCTWCQYKFDIELDVAKEAVHSGFVKLWENRETLSKSLSIKSYLNTIITNICLDLLRHKKVKEKYAVYIAQHTSDIDSNDAFDRQDLKMLENDIDNAIAALPEQMRRVFELSRSKGLKYGEIATTLNISVKTVETQMSRALVKLRQKLARYITTLIIAIQLLF